jgi:hypothetical protein
MPRARLRFRHRTAAHDRDASHPVENYDRLRKEGFLALTVGKGWGGLGASFFDHTIACEVLGEGCPSKALAFNMHASVVMPLLESVEVSAETKRRIADLVVQQGKLIAGNFSEPVSTSRGPPRSALYEPGREKSPTITPFQNIIRPTIRHTNAAIFCASQVDARWNAERQAVEFGVGIGEYHGVDRLPLFSSASSGTPHLYRDLRRTIYSTRVRDDRRANGSAHVGEVPLQPLAIHATEVSGL